jgi:aromatic ring hydroxylase
MICREAFASPRPDDHPLSAFFDEMDAWVVFDEVFVPKERVFYLRRVEMVEQLFGRVLAWASFHTLVRVTVKAEVLLGVCAAVVEYMGTTRSPQAQEALYALISFVETLRAFVHAAETNPTPSLSGLVAPNRKYVLLGRLHFMQHQARALEFVRELSGAGILMAPRHAESVSPDLSRYVDRYLLSGDELAGERYQMLKLAWDYAADAFGARQQLFEMFAGSTMPATKEQLLKQYDTSPFVTLAKQLAGIAPAAGSPR